MKLSGAPVSKDPGWHHPLEGVTIAPGKGWLFSGDSYYHHFHKRLGKYTCKKIELN